MSIDFEFKLDERLENDTVKIVSWPLCDVLLMNDEQYPWVILVPRVEGASELFHLNDEQRIQLDKESICIGTCLMKEFAGDKLNVAALGNVVKQLHIHHVIRFESDAAWPAPIWGKLPVRPYDKEALQMRLSRLRSMFESSFPSVAD